MPVSPVRPATAPAAMPRAASSPRAARCLTVEMKISLLAPGSGARRIAGGRAVRPGRALIAVAGGIHAEHDAGRTHVAAMPGTGIAVPGGR